MLDCEVTGVMGRVVDGVFIVVFRLGGIEGVQ